MRKGISHVNIVIFLKSPFSSSNVIVINISGHWVELVDKGGSVWEIVLSDLSVNLNEVIIVNVSANWVEFVNERSSVWEIVLLDLGVELNEIIIINVS